MDGTKGPARVNLRGELAIDHIHYITEELFLPPPPSPPPALALTHALTADGGLDAAEVGGAIVGGHVYEVVMTVPTGALVTFASDTPLRLGPLASIWSHAHGPVPPPEHAYLDAADGLESVGEGTVGSNASATGTATGTAAGTVAGTEADGEGSVASLTPLPPPPTAQEVSSRYPALEGGTNGGWHVVCRYRLRILPLLEGADAASSGAGAADAPQTDVLPPTTVMTRFQLHLPSLAARPYFKIVTTETDHTTYVMVTCVVTCMLPCCRAACILHVAI